MNIAAGIFTTTMIHMAMADGSVRFLSKDIDPEVIELLATARGGEKVPPAVFGPRPFLP